MGNSVGFGRRRGATTLVVAVAIIAAVLFVRGAQDKGSAAMTLLVGVTSALFWARSPQELTRWLGWNRRSVQELRAALVEHQTLVRDQLRQDGPAVAEVVPVEVHVGSQRQTSTSRSSAPHDK